MHLVPYAFLLIVGVLGLMLLTADPEGGFQSVSYMGMSHGSVDITLVRVVGGVLIVLAVLPLINWKR